MTLEEDKSVGEDGAVKAAIRSAKKAALPPKIGQTLKVSRGRSATKRQRAKRPRKSSAFEKDDVSRKGDPTK